MVSKGNKKRRGKVIRCKTCDKEIYISPSRVGKTKYCSNKCRSKGLITAKEYKCTVCGKKYSTPNSQIRHRGATKYCSKKCKGVAQRKRYAEARSDNNKYPKDIKRFKKWVWKVFSDYVRERDGWTCYTCGKYATGSAMHGGHFISRTHSSTMFDEMNVHAQCYSCNIHKHGNLGEYAHRLIKDYGLEAFEDLRIKGNQTHRFTHDELEEIYVTYRDKLKDLKLLN